MEQETITTPSYYDLDLQQRISRGLLDLTASWKVGVQSGAKRKHLVFLALSYKCFATAKAIQCLCDEGLYDDAFAMLRVIVEGTIDAVYILKSDDQVAEDYMDYPKFQAWDQLERIRSVDPQMADYFSPDEQAEMESQYQQVRARYEGNRNDDWTKDNLFKRAKFIDTQAFPALMNVTWKDASAYVHSTARSIEWRIDASGVKRSRVATKGEIATIIYYANAMLFTLLSFLEPMAGKPIEGLKTLYEEWKKS